MAGLPHGVYKEADYGKVVLPFTALRRLGCVLGPNKDAVLAELAVRQAQGMNPTRPSAKGGADVLKHFQA